MGMFCAGMLCTGAESAAFDSATEGVVIVIVSVGKATTAGAAVTPGVSAGGLNSTTARTTRLTVIVWTTSSTSTSAIGGYRTE